jgi:hypothetical protein
MIMLLAVFAGQRGAAVAARAEANGGNVTSLTNKKSAPYLLLRRSDGG